MYPVTAEDLTDDVWLLIRGRLEPEDQLRLQGVSRRFRNLAPLVQVVPDFLDFFENGCRTFVKTYFRVYLDPYKGYTGPTTKPRSTHPGLFESMHRHRSKSWRAQFRDSMHKLRIGVNELVDYSFPQEAETVDQIPESGVSIGKNTWYFRTFGKDSLRVHSTFGLAIEMYKTPKGKVRKSLLTCLEALPMVHKFA